MENPIEQLIKQSSKNQMYKFWNKYLKSVLLFLMGGAIYLLGPRDGLWDTVSGAMVICAFISL